ncbi:glycosyltransferase [Pontibacter kalidii]|uniref:glycosyltransferase n=1 Tax=Pontibacter kalidii TaxID=2592049 RepID=UPI00224D233B|nr:glycosyltransferase [Pontibacter kalidii]
MYTKESPLVSVIIPCYNHGHYLHEAIDSVRQQTYPALEIIVVDDGSTDNTATVAQAARPLTYIYQENKGLSAARNTGIRHSKGEFLVFLDADDCLYPDAVAVNAGLLLENSALAFVSGSYTLFFPSTNQVQPVVRQVEGNHYQHLLRGNYIGMHAAVMFRRWVFDNFMYDTSLKACEDYDLYLRVTRRHPVLHHGHLMAVYRQHGTNMSGDSKLMLQTTLQVLAWQQQHLQNTIEQAAYRDGINIWKAFYTQQLAHKLTKVNGFSLHDYLSFLKNDPDLSLHTLRSSTSSIAIFNKMIQILPSGKIRKKLSSIFTMDRTPAVGGVRFGHFHRYTPFSTEFGYDRGGPVDRYYIERFLGDQAHDIKGRVLEIGDNSYTLAYGGERVTKSDILHVDESNPSATLVGDISHAPHIPDNSFDCIILTQTLHLIYHFTEALHTCFRILKPGGALLLTVPGITPIDHGEWKETWYWSFTDKSMKRLMEETFPGGISEVTPYGNVFTATAFLYGMGLPEVPKTKLMYDDPHYQVIITVKATKPMVP